MNAPFNPRGSSLRAPFAAFALDDAGAETIRGIGTEMGWPDHVSIGGVRAAIDHLASATSPNILFVDMTGSTDPIADINALAEVCEAGTLVVAAGEINDVRLYRELVASGIQDYLPKPFTPEQLRDALVQAQSISASTRPPEPVVMRRHLSMAVIGVRGGVGASSVATSLAWLASEKAGRSTALLDLDVHFGTGALSLDLEPGRGLADAIENPDRIDGLFIERAMVRASEKLTVLAAEAPIHQPVMSDGFAFDRLGEELRGAFDTTVLDLPRHLMMVHPRLVQDIQVVLVVADLTLASARDCIRILAWLKTSAPHAELIVVANKVQPAATQEVSRKDFETSIERKIDVLLPYDAKSAMEAAKLGQPIARAAKSPKIAQPFADLLSAALAAGDDVPSASMPSSAGNSLLGRFGAMKGLLAKKPKDKAAA